MVRHDSSGKARGSSPKWRPETSQTARSAPVLVCPRCSRQLTEGHDWYRLQQPGTLPRCPEHGLAYVSRRELEAAGNDPLLGSTVAGRFTVLGRLGVGSMGSIYRARQEAVGRDVALKIVRRAYDPEARSRFVREARATSALVSPYTVTVFDFGEAGEDCWFLAMELLDGETVGQRLRRETRLEVGEAVTIARQALASLGEAHAKGIVHRDLKPDNLFLARLPRATGAGEGEVCKVLDFGIAKLLHADARIDQLETQAGTVFGTPRYMSPEQAQGTALDARSDIYSLGVLVFQMLTGQPPFVDEDAVVVMARHIENPPPRFEQVSGNVPVLPEVEAVVRRALCKAPEERFQTAEEFSAALEEALVESGLGGTGTHRISWVGPPASQVPTVRSRRRRRRRTVYGAAAVLGVVLLVVGVLALRRGPVTHAPAGAAGASGVSEEGPPAAAQGVVATAEPTRAASPRPGGEAARAADADAGADVAPAGSATAPAAASARARRARRARYESQKREPAAPDVRRRPEDRYGRFE